MLTKETKQTAERITEELTPIIKSAQKLGEKLQKAAAETRHAHQVANAWQYPTSRAFSEDAGEDWETIKSTRENDPKKWGEILNNKYILLSQKETAEKLARLNYHNILLYACKYLAHLLRDGNIWAQFYEKKGIESLGEYLRERTGARLYISRDGGGFSPFGSPNCYFYFNIVYYGVCAISGNDWGTYRIKEEGDPQNEKPSAPQVYTMAQYSKLINKLTTLEREAKGKAKEHYELARSSGLVYFVGGLGTPTLQTWKMRE